MAGNVSPDGYSVDGMGCAAVDEQLLEHEGHLKYRWDKFMETKKRIEDAEGSLEEFAKGYDKFGFNKKSDGSIVYREWAPAACSAFLIGDFNQWSPESHPMQKDDFGVWEITLPAGTIPHGSRVKIKMRKSDQGWVDRIPAWITYATQEPQLGAHYDGVYWDPPAGEKYERVNPRPKRPASSRIYEAHVGMSGEDPKVNTYREFADDILPRIKLGGYNTVQLMAVMEHAYYGSFGYHVTNPFAVSSRCGTPEDLKYLVDKAHGMGIRCLLDVVHCHVSCNIEDGIAGTTSASTPSPPTLAPATTATTGSGTPGFTTTVTGRCRGTSCPTCGTGWTSTASTGSASTASRPCCTTTTASRWSSRVTTSSTSAWRPTYPRSITS
jgi:1,4-alpha-glucan branching enzyme